jgi:putative addiction module component (TIGR02574 family)
MSEAAKQLLEQAMSLSPEERVRVARQLLSSVDELEEDEWERAWLAELDQRLARTLASDEPALSWEQLQQRLRSLAPG